MKRRAFTLIELLVVIAVIAVLMAILFPALRRAQELARMASCKANLRQFGVGIQMYYNDWNNKALISKGGDEFWFMQIAPYIGDRHYKSQSDGTEKTAFDQLDAVMALLKCPSTREPSKIWDGRGGQLNEGGSVGDAFHQYRYHWARVEGSYAINSWVGGWEGNFVDNSEATRAEKLRMSYRKSVATQPEVPIFMDAIWVEAMPSGKELIPTNLETGHQTDGGFGRITTIRHGWKTNVGFADGHVSSIGLEALWDLKWHREYRPPVEEVVLR